MPCCPTCACAGEPFECLAALYPAEWAKFRTYCEGTDPNLRRHVRDRSELGWSPDAPVAVPPGLALPARPPEYAFKAGEAPAPRTPVSALLLLVYACDYRSPEVIGCGCDRRHWCGLARGVFRSEPNLVTLGDCLRCVTTPEPPQEGSPSHAVKDDGAAPA